MNRYPIRHEFLPALEMRMFKRSLKAAMASILLLAAGELLPPCRIQAASSPGPQPLVRGISVASAPNGATIIEITVTQPVPYRTLQLSRPERLVVDLKGAHEADLRSAYPAHSEVLRGVRISQWQNNPAVVRVVADLKGKPAFSVTTQASGIRVQLEPRAIAQSPDFGSRSRNAGPIPGAGPSLGQTAREGPSPRSVFPVHRYKDLSASLTAPALPPHDRLVPVTQPDRSTPRKEKPATLARVSGISVKPAGKGVMDVDIASTRSVPYRVFQLAHPFRLVIDLKDARNTSRHDVYQVDSQVLKRIRIDQWRPGSSPVVRVVADLQGYPVFDVHAQRPGIRIEIRPRHAAAQRFRNPFEFRTERSATQAGRPAAASNPSTTAAAISPGSIPGNAFSDLKVIGFIEKKGSGIQAVIADRSSLYFVPEGGTFEKAFTVVAISPNGVEIQRLQTSEKTWLAYAP